jgi:predicted acyltransferase (DUF342 family)
VGINKNFVVRHGFEASTDLILADADTRKVGIGTTRPRYDFTVAGGIGATDFYLTGIGTFVDTLNVGLGGTVLTAFGSSVGVGTSLPEYLLDIRSPVSTGQTALYVQGDVRITGDIQADDIVFDDAEIQDLTVTDTFIVAGLSTFNSNTFVNADLNVSGISTLNGYLDINNNVDISGAINVGGLTTLGGYVDINNSADIGVNLNVGGATTLNGYVDINNSVDISNNLNVSGIATIANISVVGAALSNLIVPGTTILGVTSISQLNVSGIGTITTLNSTSGTITNLVGTAGTITNFNSTNANLTNISGTNLNYSGIGTIGRLNSTNGTITNLVGTAGTIINFNSTNANLTNISGTNLNYSGIGTINTLVVGTQAGKATISYTTNAARSLTIPSLGGNRTFAFIDQDQIFNGTQTFSNLNATGVSTLGNVRISSGIVTAASGIVTYYGDGSGLINLPPSTPAGSNTQVQYNNNNVFAGSFNLTHDGTTTRILSGIVTTISGTNLNYSGIGTITNIFGSNANVSGIVTASLFVGNGSGLTGIGATVADDTTTNQVFYPLLTQTTSGIVTSTKLSTTKLTFNPSTGTLTVVDLNSTSDVNLKENIKTIENSLKTVNSLRGVSFDWRETGESSYGVIAQELEEILPELVSQGETKSVNYNGLIGVLIEAVKELSNELKELKKKVL